MSSSFLTWTSMLGAVQATVLLPLATRKAISNKNRSTIPPKFRSKPTTLKILLVPPSSPSIHRARAALRSGPRRLCSWPGQRSRRVVLASVVVDAIGPALDLVLAHAADIVTDQPEAPAGFDHQVPALVDLRRPARVCEPAPAERARLVG